MLMLFIIKIYYLALKEFERESFLGKCASFQRSLSQSLIVFCAVNITLIVLGLVVSCVSRSLGLIGLLGLLCLLGLMGLMGLMGKKETHETLAHCCTIFLKSHLGIEIYMIDIEIQISISERSSDWAIN